MVTFGFFCVFVKEVSLWYCFCGERNGLENIAAGIGPVPALPSWSRVGQGRLPHIPAQRPCKEQALQLCCEHRVATQSCFHTKHWESLNFFPMGKKYK